MTTPLRFGYKASAEQFGPTELVDFAVLAEEMGFDSVFISDHFQPWMHEGGHAPAAMPVLGAMGARTSRVLLGTSVLTPTFRYHPAVVAQAFATLGVMYPNRVILGVGTGEALNEVTLGLDWPEAPERFQRLKESIALIEALWAGERVTFEGSFYSVKDATVYDRPSADAKVPIYIGAAGPAATRLAGRVADGFITTSGKPEALYTETLLPALREGLEKEGRAEDSIDTLIEVKVSFDEDRDVALEKTRFWAPLALSAEEKMGIHDPIEMQRRAAELPIERAASRFIVSTDPDEHVERIAAYVDMGFRHLVFHDPGHDQERVPAHVRRGDPAAPARALRRVTARWTLVVPVKPAAIGKSRLVVPGVDRIALARAIALDTIAAAAACDAVEQVVVVGDDGGLVILAAGIAGLRFVPEDEPRGLDAAVAVGLESFDGPRAALLGDLPALRPGDLAVGAVARLAARPCGRGGRRGYRLDPRDGGGRRAVGVVVRRGLVRASRRARVRCAAGSGCLDPAPRRRHVRAAARGAGARPRPADRRARGGLTPPLRVQTTPQCPARRGRLGNDGRARQHQLSSR